MGGDIMVDEIDIANDLMHTEVSRALNKIRQNASSGGLGPKLCRVCANRIQQARRKLGYKLCVECAKEAERRKSQYNDR